MRIIIILLLILSCAGCKDDNIISDEDLSVDDEYIEIVPSNALPFIEQIEENKVLLSYEEIINYNREIASKTNTIYDLNSIVGLTKEEILDYINFYKLPKLPKYDGTKQITTEDTRLILDNLNIDSVEDKDTLLKAIVINRTNLKSFPTYLHFYNSKNAYNFDNLQESELHINTPVLIMHNSKDQKWSFVLTPTYVGWVNNDDIAFADELDWSFFIENTSFGIITAASLYIENRILDMGVRLPHVGTSNEGYELVVPIKDNSGKVGKKEVVISNDSAHIGYLPYTKKNVYIQAFKYEGEDYRWGGMDYSVDCSSYISNVYRTFGFVFPRNTSSQNESIGEIISLADKNMNEKKEIISNNYPSILFQPGHAMIYLGKNDGNHYVIHASGKDMKVVVTKLDNSSYLKEINKVILIN